MALAPGTRLGPYEITAPIGAGGMGEVYSARDTRLDRDVAIKVLPPDVAGNSDLLARFRREAKTISSLNHPHICTLFDVGEENGASFLVMELMDGESLADRLSRGPLPLDQVLKLGAQIADALDAAHRQGIVHRDLKPGNVMVTRGGAKLLDFGLARTAAERAPIQGHSQMATEAQPLTAAGTILGTFQYMAPEQLEGQEADARTDIFALGALLYEMSTGRRAFQGSSRTSLIAAIVSSQPEPISQVTDLAPPALDQVVRQCLEKDPEDRWQSARDVAAQLRWVSEAGSRAGVAAPVSMRRRTRARLAWGLAGVLAVLLAASNFYWLRSIPAPPAPIELTIPARTEQYEATGGGLISPDGQKVVMSIRNPGGDWGWAIRELASATITPLPALTDMSPLCWSPDGSELGVGNQNRLAVLDLAAGTLRELGETGGIVRGADWGANDVILFAIEGDGIYRISPAGGDRKQVAAPDPERSEITVSWPLVLPDGDRFLYVGIVREPGRQDYRFRLNAGRLDAPGTTLVGEVASRVQLLPSGHLLHVAAGALMATPFDSDRLALTGRPVPVADGVANFAPVGEAAFHSAKDGTIIFIRRELQDTMYWVDATGTLGEALGERGEYSSLDISPDGTQVAVTVTDPRNGASDIWLYGTRRSTRSRLTVHPYTEATPVWLASGEAVLYFSDKERRPDIFMKSLDDSGGPSLVLGTEGLEFPMDVSPDGRFLLYATDESGTLGQSMDLWVLEMDRPEEKRPFVTAPESQYHARFSPDGRWVAYTSVETGRPEVWLKPFPGPGRSIQISTEGGRLPRWAPDGQTLSYAESRTRVLAVDLATPESRANPEPRHQFDTPFGIRTFDVGPDGRFLMVLRDESVVEPIHVILNWSPPAG